MEKIAKVVAGPVPDPVETAEKVSIQLPFEVSVALQYLFHPFALKAALDQVEARHGVAVAAIQFRALDPLREYIHER